MRFSVTYERPEALPTDVIPDGADPAGSWVKEDGTVWRPIDGGGYAAIWQQPTLPKGGSYQLTLPGSDVPRCWYCDKLVGSEAEIVRGRAACATCADAHERASEKRKRVTNVTPGVTQGPVKP